MVKANEDGLIDRGDGMYVKLGRVVPIEQDIEIETTFNSGESFPVLYYPDPYADQMAADGLYKKEAKYASWVNDDGILVEQDVEIRLKDGTILYADIFRPANSTEKVPVIMEWGFYGKGDAATATDWQLMGVPNGAVSPMAKSEAADPGYWCHHGYAIANVDGRGAGHSTDNLVIWGEQDGKDGAEVIEWLAAREWCNGKVGMYGNSGLAMCQIWIAAEQPEHLACIAPWECTTDMYREFMTWGGISWPSFQNMVMTAVRSGSYIEDIVGMLEKYPTWNAYWESKVAAFNKVKCPAYFAAGWCHTHLRGTINAFRKCKSQKKWLRAHREFEWGDGYHYENIEDLRRFYDRYLKNIYNGWEFTPKVRLQVMDTEDYDAFHYRGEDNFPIKRTQYTKYYLNAEDMSLNAEPVTTKSSVTYDSEEGQVNFSVKFTEDTELSGYMWLHLNVAAASADDMDMFVNVRKLGADGNEVPVSICDGEPHPGAWGAIRVSHRALDEKLTTKFNPVQSHLTEEKIVPGQVYPIDIEIWPHSRMWHAGESLNIQISGDYIRDPNWFTNLPFDLINEGDHIIYTGGTEEEQSWLQVPVIPPKYQSPTLTIR